MKNENLKNALERDSRPAYEVAASAGINKATLSYFCIGAQVPSERQKKSVASVLGYPVEAIFPEYD